MAYDKVLNLQITMKPEEPYINIYGFDTKIQISAHILDNSKGFFALVDDYNQYKEYNLYYIGHNDNIINYKTTSYKKGDIVDTYSGKYSTLKTSIFKDNIKRDITKVEISGGAYQGEVTTGGGYKLNYNTTIEVPIFKSSDLDSIINYIDNGDTSGAIKDFSTKWTLYIDGKSNPLYKLTWDCENLKDIDTSNTTIAIWVGSFNSLDNSFNDEDGTKFKEVPYDNKSCKFSYNDISKLVDHPLIGHNPACIRVQLAYRKFETARVETSTSMGCDLYYSSAPQGYLYDVIGYLTLTDGVWYKTDQGDGSTFTVKDGKEGSDGYTNDNDK